MASAFPKLPGYAPTHHLEVFKWNILNNILL